MLGVATASCASNSRGSRRGMRGGRSSAQPPQPQVLSGRLRSPILCGLFDSIDLRLRSKSEKARYRTMTLPRAAHKTHTTYTSHLTYARGRAVKRKVSYKV